MVLLNSMIFTKAIFCPSTQQLVDDLKNDKARLVVSTWQESVTATDEYPTDEQHDVDLILEKFC